MNTDNAPSLNVLAAVRTCASSWDPDARIIGNVRAGDIVRSLDEVVEATFAGVKLSDIGAAIDSIREGQGDG
jgi:hypothetical protein